MPNWYASREALKRAARIDGADRDPTIDRLLEAASRSIDLATRRFFIPKTETRLYRWPRPSPAQAHILWLDQDLLSVTTLQTKAQNTSPTSIAAADFFVEPNNLGPPFNRIEIDLSSTSAFEAGDTPQRSISVLGSWGYGDDTQSAGTVTSGLDADATATSMVCSDGSAIDVGDTLLIESEQIFVSERTNAAEPNNDLLNGALTASKAGTTVTVDDGSRYTAGEVILVDSERMFIESISTNDLSVIRAYDGTTLAAHNDNTAVHVFRTLTIVRAQNGTTGATHANSTAISRYRPAKDIEEWCLAEAIAAFQQEQSGWGRMVGTGDGQTELSGRALADLRKRVGGAYMRAREAAI